MASRTGASMGILAALAFFALLSLVMFVLFVIFAARAQRNASERDALREDLAVAIRPEEQNDRWEELKRAAASQRKGVVAYLDETNAQLIRTIGGSRRDTAETLQQKLQERLGGQFEGQEIPPLLTAFEQMNGKLASMTSELEDAKRARDAAQADMRQAIDRLDESNKENAQTVATLQEQIGANKQDVDRYRTDVNESKRTFEERLSQTRADAEQRVAGLEGDLDKAKNRIYILEEQLQNCRGNAKATSLGGTEEAALVDGTVLAVNPLKNEVSINLGRRDHVVLGMTFEVYNVGTVLRPDKDGNYPEGKAAIEVIRIDDRTSRARVIRTTKGNPIIQGDQLVNALYDPNKTYVFTVFGNFDTNGDGVPTAQGTDVIRGFVQQWGGQLADDIAGNTDFLVLGAPPILPPQPRVDDPVEVIERYLKLSQEAQRYEDLFDTAKKTGIPVLDQNRFYTLTGLNGRR